MLKARLGQLQDRGLPAITREAASKFRALRAHRASARHEIFDDFDRKYGTDTSGIIQPWDLDIPDNLVGQAIQYRTARIGVFTELLASLDIRHEHYSFIDLGSGKGRALLEASRFPFKRIIGVELATGLHHISTANIGAFRAEWQRCTHIVSLRENVCAFTFPADNTVLYLYNPFSADTMRVVVANLESSMRAVPRRVYVIYVKPVHKRVLDETTTLSLLHTLHGNVIYVNHLAELASNHQVTNGSQ